MAACVVLSLGERALLRIGERERVSPGDQRAAVRIETVEGLERELSNALPKPCCGDESAAAAPRTSNAANDLLIAGKALARPSVASGSRG